MSYSKYINVKIEINIPPNKPEIAPEKVLFGDIFERVKEQYVDDIDDDLLRFIIQ